jgi:hypothetical protein
MLTKKPNKTRTPCKTSALLLDAREIPLVMRKIKGAKRLSVRYRPLNEDVLLTFPHYVSFKQAEEFVATKHQWLEKQIRTHGTRVEFSEGRTIPVLGQECLITRHDGRGMPRIEEGRLHIYCAPEFLPRRVRDFLIAEARREISLLAHRAAERLERHVRSIALRDTGSRWGSCTASGELSFSWRLVLAPREVMDYVVFHEVAHLVELNHSARFWNIVEQLCPTHEQAQAWLRTRGHTLYHYG